MPQRRIPLSHVKAPTLHLLRGFALPPNGYLAQSRCGVVPAVYEAQLL